MRPKPFIKSCLISFKTYAINKTTLHAAGKVPILKHSLTQLMRGENQNLDRKEPLYAYLDKKLSKFEILALAIDCIWHRLV